MNCPKCNSECDRDEADVGVGILYGPWGCYSCGWSEIDRAAVEAEYPGYYCDPTGGLTKIATIVDGCARFGLDAAAAEAFREPREYPR